MREQTTVGYYQMKRLKLEAVVDRTHDSGRQRALSHLFREDYLA